MTKRWSSVRADIRRLMAPAVAKRLDVHVAMYRAWREEDGRAWFTWDGSEIASFDDAPFWRRALPLHEALKGVGVDVDESWDRALATATRERGPNLPGFYDSVADYLASRATAALESPDPLVRALAMIDRRVGKRTLTSRELDGEPHALVRRFRELRCVAEGWSVKRSSNTDPAGE